MKKYKVLIRGENFLLNRDGKDQKLGFYTTAFVEGQDEAEAEKQAIALVRGDQEFGKGVLNEKADSPMMFVEEIEELASFDGLYLPRSGFSFYSEEEKRTGHSFWKHIAEKRLQRSIEAAFCVVVCAITTGRGYTSSGSGNVRSEWPSGSAATQCECG